MRRSAAVRSPPATCRSRPRSSSRPSVSPPASLSRSRCRRVLRHARDLHSSHDRYSFRLKHVALLDVVILALLYTGRVIAGSVATVTWPSPWLLAFSLFFFLSLAFVKRFSELQVLRQNQRESTKVRGYYPSDLEQIASEGAASGYIAVLVAALYINSQAVVAVYSEPIILWMICPVLLYWISRCGCSRTVGRCTTTRWSSRCAIM